MYVKTKSNRVHYTDYILYIQTFFADMAQLLQQTSQVLVVLGKYNEYRR